MTDLAGRSSRTRSSTRSTRGDILLHHPYESFENSVLRFLESGRPTIRRCLAIKLTIYRTSKRLADRPGLAEAARRGKQVAVLVEITARFDEAPNIAWGRFLEEGRSPRRLRRREVEDPREAGARRS